MGINQRSAGEKQRGHGNAGKNDRFHLENISI